MLTGHERISDQMRQRFNNAKYIIQTANGSGGTKKGQKKQFVKV